MAAKCAEKLIQQIQESVSSDGWFLYFVYRLIKKLFLFSSSIFNFHVFLCQMWFTVDYRREMSF